MTIKHDFPIFPLKSLSQHDFQNYLHSCFVLAKVPEKDNEWDWKYLVQVSGEGMSSEVHLATYNTKPKIYPLGEVEFNWSYPQPGFYDFKEGVQVFTRLPRRQWIRGICSSNSHFRNPFKTLRMKYGDSLIPDDVWKTMFFEFTCSALNQMFLKRADPNIKKALESIRKEKELMRALSREFAISQGLFSDNPTIWSLSGPIGELESSTRIKLSKSLFAAELEDLVKPHNLEVTVSTEGQI